MRWHLVCFSLCAATALAQVSCADDALTEVDFDGGAPGDDAEGDAIIGGGEAATDSESASDSLTSDADATAIDTGTKSDTGTSSDVAPGDSSSTMFACGTETCSSKFQFCHKATSPGTCPAPDSGLCPPGCPGCPTLGFHCESLPSKCFAAPSCMCLVGEVCGFSGMCDEMGGFTVGCTGI